MSTVTRVEQNQLDPSKDVTFATDPDLWLEQKFAALGKGNTKRAGEVFVELATDNHNRQIVTLASRACVGIASL